LDLYCTLDLLRHVMRVFVRISSCHGPLASFTTRRSSGLEPRTFSFNSPYGACPACEGLATREGFVPELVIPDASLSLSGGAIAPDRKRTRLNSSHVKNSYAIFCLKKKTTPAVTSMKVSKQ